MSNQPGLVYLAGYGCREIPCSQLGMEIQVVMSCWIFLVRMDMPCVNINPIRLWPVGREFRGGARRWRAPTGDTVDHQPGLNLFSGVPASVLQSRWGFSFDLGPLYMLRAHH